MHFKMELISKIRPSSQQVERAGRCYIDANHEVCFFFVKFSHNYKNLILVATDKKKKLNGMMLLLLCIKIRRLEFSEAAENVANVG